jgi:amino acid synthesis protein
MIEIRKTITIRETVFSELGVEAARPITRAVGMAVIRNPFAGQFVEDLRPLFEAGGNARQATHARVGEVA